MNNIGLLILATIGVTLIIKNLWIVIEELCRAIRQSHRVATIISREYGTRKTTYKQWWYCFKDEVFSYYSTKELSIYEIDYNPSIKAKRRYH